MTDPLVTSDVLSPAEGQALFDRACQRTLNVSGAVFLTAYDAGVAWDRWDHAAVVSLSMLVPFAR